MVKEKNLSPENSGLVFTKTTSLTAAIISSNTRGSLVLLLKVNFAVLEFQEELMLG